MEANSFDRVTRFFAERRLTRRQAIQQGGAGLAAVGLTSAAGLTGATAQDATPEATPLTGPGGEKIPYLFLQSFESGTIAPKEGAEGAFTVTLQHGLGQTIYFSDRPARDVGTVPTGQFLDGLGFQPDNPPNAALVVDTGAGAVDIAVVELTNPAYDESSATASYDLTVLENFEREVDMEFREGPQDLSSIPASFDVAHLFIDDCPDKGASCQHWNGQTGFQPEQGSRFLGTRGTCWSFPYCYPCDQEAYDRQCAETFPDFCNATTFCKANMDG